MAEPLSEGYYLDNFTTVLDHVADYRSSLLGPTEWTFLQTFRHLSLSARRLYVRLYSRKGPLFREDKLSYPEIGDLSKAASETIAAGVMDEAPEADKASLIDLLVKPELLQLLPESSLPASVDRAALVEQVSSALTTEGLREKIGFRVLRPVCIETVDVFRLLFFGNLDQDLTEFILSELGIQQYENYVCEPNSLFDTRHQLDEALTFYGVRREASELIAELDAAALVNLAARVPAFEEPVFRRRAGRLLGRIGRQLERLDEGPAALSVYQRSEFPPARERRARLLSAQGDPTSAISLCEDMLASPLDQTEYDFARDFPRRRQRGWNLALVDWPQRQHIEIETRSLELSAGDERVEERVREYRQCCGDRAWYVENLLFPGLFGLAFWDVIFHPVAGAFLHPFQRGPLDLYEPDFRFRRAEQIAARFEEIKDQQAFCSRVAATFQDRWGRANPFVHWGGLDEALLAMALEQIPVTHCIAIFERLLRDVRTNRSGFPDLVTFPAGESYRLIEVKGPGDALQRHQRRWLEFFVEQEIPAEVVNVTWR